MALELTGLASSETTTVQLWNPATYEDLDMFVDCHTPDSKHYQAAVKKYSKSGQRASIKTDRKNRRTENEILLPESDEEADRHILVAAIIRIRQPEKGNESTPAEVEQMSKDPQYSWIFEQTSAHLRNREHFFGVSEDNASSSQQTKRGATAKNKEAD